MIIRDDFTNKESFNDLWDSSITTPGCTIEYIDNELVLTQANPVHGGVVVQSKKTIDFSTSHNINISANMRIDGPFNNSSASIQPYIGLVSKNSNREPRYYKNAINKNLVAVFNVYGSIFLGNIDTTMTTSDGTIALRNQIVLNGVCSIGAYFKIDINIFNNIITVRIDNVVKYSEQISADMLNFLTNDNIVFEMYIGNYNSKQKMYFKDITIYKQSISFIPKLKNGNLSLSTLEIFNTDGILTPNDFEFHGTDNINTITEKLNLLEYKDMYKINMHR